MRTMGLFGIAVLVAGCSGARSGLFPLEVGNTWSYSVRGGFVTRVVDLKVLSIESVAGVRGFKLDGPMGSSRIAWNQGILVAEELAGSRFSPPVQLLDSNQPAQHLLWNGLVSAMGRTSNAIAVVTQSNESFEIAGRKYPAVVSTVELQTAGRSMELKTWYVDGIGPVRQEQRNNGTLYPSAIYLSGP